MVFMHSAVLDEHGKYHLKWRFDEKTITFETEVETKGYVGFGLSPTGRMAFSDIVIGGVEKGQPYLQDYFADMNREVLRDYHQNYRLEYAMENSTHTILGFSRDLHTCDINDKPITESTIRVIWAYHSEDFGHPGPKYHGLNRGTKSLRLLNPESHTVTNSGTAFFDIRHNNVPVPFKDTTYWCKMFKIPEVDRKHHIIKIEPLIQKGHENVVHHMLLYQCDSNLNDTDLEMGHECFHPNMPDSYFTCESVIFAWAVGGEGFTYPPHVGVSIGMTLDPVYILMEMHYDNPTNQEGLIDSSGLRLFYTPVLREYDAGVIETGVWISLFHIIPPGLPEYISEGHCTTGCLQEALEHEMPSGIHVFAVLLHSHLAGQSLKTRHFRNGDEQQPLAYDNEYDFNFQELQYLKEERTLLPGDHLVTECKYNTIDRTNVTLGGLSTRDEMCLSYLLYYPRINLTRCESLPVISKQLQFIGVKEIYEPVTTWPFIIKSPKKYNNLSFIEAMDKFRWSKKKGNAFNDLVRQLPMNVRCSKHGEENWLVHGLAVSPPEVKQTGEPQLTTCNRASPLHLSSMMPLFPVICAAYSTIRIRWLMCL
ncbi:DBH-like monooxygenase protein 1 homolog isoform X2 [Polyodon spathula]|nr:DBH-like monooxygenase protein 1 homolog isoform X2 [Polyodon spathula]XP_041108249.1 DBH-like monooxygenase protein 1 homolog isoform X2 [Polyodon spathula]